MRLNEKATVANDNTETAWWWERVFRLTLFQLSMLQPVTASQRAVHLARDESVPSNLEAPLSVASSLLNVVHTAPVAIAEGRVANPTAIATITLRHAKGCREVPRRHWQALAMAAAGSRKRGKLGWKCACARTHRMTT